MGSRGPSPSAAGLLFWLFSGRGGSGWKVAAHKRSARSRLFEMLGGRRCNNYLCPIPREKLHPLAVDISHKFNDGNQDRKKFGGNDALIRYYLEHPNEAKEKLEVLCCYCNKLRQLLKQIKCLCRLPCCRAPIRPPSR